MTTRGNKKPVAFVLDMGSNGLGIARSLGRVGIRVIGMDFTRGAPGFASRYCQPLAAPDPVREPEKLLGALLAEARKHARDGIIFPASDTYVLFVSRFREELSQCFRFAIPSQEILESIINKRRQYELAEKIGIPYPRTRYPQDLSDMEHIKNELDYPIFIKPYYSHIWQQKYANKGFKVNNARELVERQREISAAGLQVLLQSIVAGPDTNIVEVYVYMSNDHVPLATFTTRKLRQYPNNFGVATCLKTLHDQCAVETALKFLKGVQYVGLGSMELKKDEVDGKYKLLELNARLPTHNAQAACAGINFPLIQYLDLTSHEIPTPNDYEDGVMWLDAIPDLLASYELWKSGGLTIFDWLRSTSKAHCHSYFAWDDIKPFIRDAVMEISLTPEYLFRKYIHS